MSAYAAAGVDYEKIEPFKRIMQSLGQKTRSYPARWNMKVWPGAHGANFEYVGGFDTPVSFVQTTEGLGNKNWIAEWMYQFDGTGYPRYACIARDTMLMATNDTAASGAMPFLWTDDTAAGDSGWFSDEKRALVFAEGCRLLAWELGLSIPAGESPALKYLVNACSPVKSAPVLSGTATGIIGGPYRRIDDDIVAGDRIVGFRSSGVHANGISLIIERAMRRKDAFLEKMPSGVTVGEEVLTATCNYAPIVGALARAGLYVRKFLPGTGGGVAKLAASKAPFTYRIHTWPSQGEIFHFIQDVYGVSEFEMLTTFNCGIGYYAFVPHEIVESVLRIAQNEEVFAWEVGIVEEGPRRVIFGPKDNLILPPPAG